MKPTHSFALFLACSAIACSAAPDDAARTASADTTAATGAPATTAAAVMSCGDPTLPNPTTDPGYRAIVAANESDSGEITFPSSARSWTLNYVYVVPPLPCTPTWSPVNRTLYVWGDVSFDEYGTDGTYSLPGSSYRFNQIVPQLMIGDVLSGNSPSYAPSWGSYATWIIQSSYFWQKSDGTNYSMTGPVVHVLPGDKITTSISYSPRYGSIVAKISSVRGTSSITLPRPFPNEPGLFRSWRDFFEQAEGQSGNLLGLPQLNVESHGVDQDTMCAVLPWTIDYASLPGVPATSSSYHVMQSGGLTCPTRLANLNF